jgi:hypothetical protein
MANVGDYLTIKGVKKRWAGENYGWQTPASYSQLEKQGKFKVGAQFLDRLGSYLGPALQQVQGFQQQVRKATPFLDPVENVVNRAVVADDKLPSSRVAIGGAVAAQRAGNVLNIDPRIAGIGGLLIGGVHTSGPKAGTYKWRPTGDLKPHVDAIEERIEAAHHHFKKYGTLSKGGFNRDILDANGNVVARATNQGNVVFESRTGISPRAVVSKPASAPKANVSTAVQALDDAKTIAKNQYGIDGINYDRLLEEVPVSSILDPRYVARVEQLHKTYKSNTKALKEIVVERPDRTLNSLIGQPTPDLWPILSKFSISDLSDVNKAADVFKSLYTELDKRPKLESWGVQFVEGHHPIQVESVAAASEHLSSMYDRLRFTEKLMTDYTYSGTASRDMFPLSKTGHTGAMNPNGIQMSAHVGMTQPDLAKPELTRRTGSNWSLEDFTNITDPDKLAKVFWQRSGEPQMRMSEIAFDQPAEQLLRERGAKIAGVKPKDLYTLKADKTRKSEIRPLLESKGVTSEVFKGLMIQAYRDANGTK